MSLISFVVIFSLVLSGVFELSFSKQEAKTIKIKNNVYDCIDFYKQPAFNHPLLKNLTFKEKQLPNLAKLQRQLANDFGFKDGGCPIGTVPILRVSPNLENVPYNEDPLAVAVVQTKYRDYPSKSFYGVSGSLSLWRPLEQYRNQWSSARIKLKNGGESIEAGWRINPDMYKDNETHLYVELLSKTASCVFPCTAFVQVSGGVPLGGVPDHYSQIRQVDKPAILYVWDISIDKHQDDGNWWLSMNGKKNVVGYWPKLTLTYLRQVANQVDWGGEARFGPDGDFHFPEMGSSKRAFYDLGISASILHMKVVNKDFQSVEPEDTTKVWNYEKDYTVLDAGYEKNHGRLMYYGGPYGRWPEEVI